MLGRLQVVTQCIREVDISIVVLASFRVCLQAYLHWRQPENLCEMQLHQASSDPRAHDIEHSRVSVSDSTQLKTRQRCRMPVARLLAAVLLFAGSCNAQAPLPRDGWTVVASSAEARREDGSAGRAVDGDSATIWHTRWSGTPDNFPHTFTIELAEPTRINALTYLPRQVRSQLFTGMHRTCSLVLSCGKRGNLARQAPRVLQQPAEQQRNGLDIRNACRMVARVLSTATLASMKCSSRQTASASAAQLQAAHGQTMRRSRPRALTRLMPKPCASPHSPKLVAVVRGPPHPRSTC